MRSKIKSTLVLSLTIICLAACSKKDSTPAAVPKDITGHASYFTINASSNIPTGMYINFTDQDGKVGNAHLLAVLSSDANATLSISNPDFSAAASAIRVNPNSGDFIDMLPLASTATVTIAIDNPITAANGVTYKSLSVNQIDVVNAEVNYTVGMQMTSASEASNNYPMGKAYFKMLLTKAPGRYRLTF